MSEERRTYRVKPHHGPAGCRRALARGSCTCVARAKRTFWQCCGWYCGKCNKAIGEKRRAEAREVE